MKNKVLVKLSVPEIDAEYDVFLPINKKIGNIIVLLNKTINEFSEGEYPISKFDRLYNATTLTQYEIDVLLLHTDIRNGTRLVLVS